MTLVIRGLMAKRLAFTRTVGRGSRAQVDGFIDLIMFSTSCCVVSEKQQKGWAAPDCGWAVESVELEKRDLMESTFFLKKVTKLSHRSSEASERGSACGLRRWRVEFMVENNFLEFPWLLLMMFEYNCDLASLRDLA